MVILSRGRVPVVLRAIKVEAVPMWASRVHCPLDCLLISEGGNKLQA